MATIQVKGEQVRRAVKWISEEIKSANKKMVGVLIQEAALRFNLSPKDEESLREFYEQ